MVWTNKDYPVSMKNLETKVRHKAIEIANALLDDGYEEGRAISIAVSQAKKWAEKDANRPLGGEDQHVVPKDGKWAIKKEHHEKASYIFDTKEEAVKRAKEIAKKQLVYVVIHRRDGTIQDTVRP